MFRHDTDHSLATIFMTFYSCSFLNSGQYSLSFANFSAYRIFFSSDFSLSIALSKFIRV